jgi:hypothetical protein
LRRGDFTRLWSTDGTYAFSRSFEGNTFVIALNASESPQQAEVTFAAENAKAVFGEASNISVRDGHLKFKILPRSGVVIQ